jgi:signal transduction histidine kinase
MTVMMQAKHSADATNTKRSWNVDLLFGAAKKETVIHLRWPLVILSSYLLYYAPVSWLSVTQVQAILSLYLLSHATLYFIADDFFDSPYFYGPLLVFDTLVLVVVIVATGATSPDFYIACVVTLVLSLICNDSRGLLVVTILAPLIYAYALFSSSTVLEPEIFLQLPFPFVISLFYGYFAQVGRMRRLAQEKEEEVRREQRAAEELRRQRERLEAMHEVNVAVTSTNETNSIVNALLEKTLSHLPYAAALVRLRDPESQLVETVAAKGFDTKERVDADSLSFIDGIMKAVEPLIVRNVFADNRVEHLEFFKKEGLVSIIGMPLVANGETLGCLVYAAREEHGFGAEEIEFLNTLAGQAAIAIHHSQLYRQSQQQTEELRHAHLIKDEFLKMVSNELKTPLSVISGYSDMFNQGLLGELTPIQEKAIETIGRQSRELHGLISKVLQVSDIESETLLAAKTEINLWEFMSELRAEYDAPLAKNVKIIWDYPADLPTVQSDRPKLKRIAENLINNAVKFTEHGSVVISANYLAPSRILELKVADTGIGMSSERRGVIFQKFRQLHEAHRVLQPGGVGLGLYIVKKYMDVLGGEIGVESEPAKGSTFIMRIPVALHKRVALHEQLLLPTGIESFSLGSEQK